MGSFIAGFTIKSTFRRFVHKLNIYQWPFLINLNCATVKNKFLKNDIFSQKSVKMNSTQFLKHLIKLVKNFKTHCYAFIFSNISHLASGNGEWGGHGPLDQERFKLRERFHLWPLQSSNILRPVQRVSKMAPYSSSSALLLTRVVP